MEGRVGLGVEPTGIARAWEAIELATQKKVDMIGAIIR